jgi:hypothetical protein
LGFRLVLRQKGLQTTCHLEALGYLSEDEKNSADLQFPEKEFSLCICTVNTRRQQHMLKLSHLVFLMITGFIFLRSVRNV